MQAIGDRVQAHLRPRRIDLAGVALDILAWGGQPLTFEWFEAPRADRLQTALDLLRRLGALSDGRLTQLGQQMQRLPLHPRLARMVLTRVRWSMASNTTPMPPEPSTRLML